MNLQLDGTNFKLDTRAEVTAVLESTYKQLHDCRILQKLSKMLYGPACQSLKVVWSLLHRNGGHAETLRQCPHLTSVWILKHLRKCEEGDTPNP